MGKDTYTEISEKKTSKLGYLFLIALFIFLIIIGQTVFHDIQKIPKRPKAPSYCVNSYLGNLKAVTQEPRCYFTAIDKKFKLDILVSALKPTINNIISINRDISKKSKQINTNERTIHDLLRTYDVSLQETIANEEALMDKPEIKNQIVTLRAANEKFRAQIKESTPIRDAIIKSIHDRIKELSSAYSRAKDHYNTKAAYYNFKIFLLKILFVLPVFLVFLRLYTKFKKKDSPYTIIVTSVFFASTILLLEIVLVFLYDILPKQWLERIFKILMESPVLRYVVYYGAVILVISLLGGIVYFIQKKIYDPQRVAARHLKSNKCPGCSFDLRLSESYCPNCGRQIRTECPSCNHRRYKDLASCPYCGT